MSYSIDFRHLASVLSLETLAQTLGAKQPPHQGGKPRPRLFARHPCETLQLGGHGQRPLGGGPCVARALSPTATPWFGPPDRMSTRVWMAPTSQHHPPCPGSYTGSRAPAARGATLGSPGLPRLLHVRLDTASDPGEYPHRSPWRDTRCRLPVGQNRRHSPTQFSGLNTFKVGSTRDLCTSPAFVPTHRRAGYPPRRKGRYGARGSRLPRRDSHPLEHAALPGRTVPLFSPEAAECD